MRISPLPLFFRLALTATSDYSGRGGRFFRHIQITNSSIGCFFLKFLVFTELMTLYRNHSFDYLQICYVKNI